MHNAFSIAPIVAALALGAAARSPVGAQPSNALFSADKEACFGRVYAPRQQVASLRVARLNPATEKDSTEQERAPPYDLWWYNVKLAISLTLKTGNRVAATRYSCHPGEANWNCRREAAGEAAGEAPSACNDRNIQIVRGPGDEILLQNRNSGLPIDNECETASVEQQNPTKPLTRSDDKTFRLSRMPMAACRPQ